MSWLPLALAAPALLTLVNFIDKFLIERAIRDHRAMPLFGGFIGALASTILWLAGVNVSLAVGDALILLTAGILVIVGAIFYFRAISLEQTSTIILIFQATPLLTLLLGWLLLGETIGGWQLVGFFLILISAIAISIQPGAGSLRISLAAYLMLIVSLTVASRSIMVRTMTGSPDLGTLLVYLGWGQGIGALILYLFGKAYRRALHQAMEKIRPATLGILAINETLFLIAAALGNQALTLGPAALVNVLGGTASFYGILFGAVLTLIAPSIFKESIARRELLRKSALALLLFAGLGFVVLGNAT
jgi:uncharacterized membrane protein